MHAQHAAQEERMKTRDEKWREKSSLFKNAAHIYEFWARKGNGRLGLTKRRSGRMKEERETPYERE